MIQHISKLVAEVGKLVKGGVRGRTTGARCVKVSILRNSGNGVTTKTSIWPIVGWDVSFLLAAHVESEAQDYELTPFLL